jgi:hypothetical protein
VDFSAQFQRAPSPFEPIMFFGPMVDIGVGEASNSLCARQRREIAPFRGRNPEGFF